MTVKEEIRVTRPGKYPPTTPREGRQGHYFYGNNLVECIMKAQRKFGDELVDVEYNGWYIGSITQAQPEHKFPKQSVNDFVGWCP